MFVNMILLLLRIVIVFEIGGYIFKSYKNKLINIIILLNDC